MKLLYTNQIAKVKEVLHREQIILSIVSFFTSYSLVRIKLWIDGTLKFEHGADEFAVFDFELFTMPPVLRKVLQIMKLGETIELTTIKRDKLKGFFVDERNN